MRFTIYKRGQGSYTRLGTAFGLALIVGLGCLRLFDQLRASDFGLSPNAEMWIQVMVPVLLFVVLSLFIHWVVNKPKIANFMIDAEGEMKKVSWSSRKEIFVSTFIVIIVVIVMAIFLGIADLGFQLFFSEVIGI